MESNYEIGQEVKNMEVLVLKRRHVVLTNSEDEDAENSSKQGRNLQEESLDEMVRSIMKDKSEDFETPTQGKTLGEANISLKGLEAAETLAKVLTQRTKTYTRKVKTGLRRKLDADEVNTYRNYTWFTDVILAFEEINSERQQAQEEAEMQEKMIGKTKSLIAKRVHDESELSETQKNRMAQVQEAAKYYTKDDWDSVRAKLEANRDLSSKLEASKLKRTGINLQAKVFKKQKITNVPDVTKDESKNKSESARSDTEEDVEAYMDERVDEPALEEFQMGSIPQGSAPAKIDKWQILKTGVVQTINLKYRDEAGLKKNKKEAVHIYMLIEVKYPLPSRVCQAMLEKRLIGDRKDEVTILPGDCHDSTKWISYVHEQIVYYGKASSNPLIADDSKIIWKNSIPMFPREQDTQDVYAVIEDTQDRQT
ncbi:hypothetical protein Tco_0529534 [Tanacetum coccineum]